MHLTFRQLQVYAEVAHQGSVLRAAQNLHLTPPGVSQLIREVERQVGQTLFDRSGRRMALTTSGEYFLFYARKLLATMKDAEDSMARLARLETGRLTIGMATAAKYFLPQLLADFHDEHPAVEIRLRLGGREHLGRLLEEGDADLCVMGRAPRELPCRAEPFAMHPHGLITAPDHRFALAEAVPAAALADEPFIVREAESGTRHAMQEYLDAYRLRPTFLMEMPSNEAIKQAVMAGLGVSLMSLHTIALELRNDLVAVPVVEGLPLVRRWNIVHLAGKHLSPAAEAFRYFVLEHGEARMAAMFRPVPPPPSVPTATSGDGPATYGPVPDGPVPDGSLPDGPATDSPAIDIPAPGGRRRAVGRPASPGAASGRRRSARGG